MATIILAAGQTKATSTTVVLASGANANIVGYAPTGGAWASADVLEVRLDTNGESALVGTITNACRRYFAQGPGTYSVVRPATASDIGVSTA